MGRWTEPWCVVSDGWAHVCTVQDIVSGETRDALLVRMRIYANRVTEVFQHLEHQTQYHIKRISQAKNAATGNEYVVLVRTG